MLRFIGARVLQGAAVLLAVSVLVFMLSHASGDPAAMVLPPEATPQQLQEYRVKMGFDRPIWEQYWDFLRGVVTLHFGKSYIHNEDAMAMVLGRILPTLALTGAAILITIVVAVPLGTIAALRRGTWIDKAVGTVALLGQSVPHFFLGIMLILIFSVNLRWFPTLGSQSLQGIVLPALTLGLYAIAENMRLLRSSLLEVLNEDYIRTARAKGVSERVVIAKHAMRNALIPVLTVLMIQIGTLLGGAVITETVFSYPGMGLLVIQAINNRDILVIQAFVIVVAVIVVVINVLLDVFYGLLDPRIKIGAAR